MEAKPRGLGAVDQSGALIDVTLHDKIPIKFTLRTDETKKNELWRFQYVGGAFRGEGTWKLEAIDGNTKVSYRWCGSMSGLFLRVLTFFTNIPKSHSKIMKSGFAGLSEHIRKSVESQEDNRDSTDLACYQNRKEV